MYLNQTILKALIINHDFQHAPLCIPIGDTLFEVAVLFKRAYSPTLCVFNTPTSNGVVVTFYLHDEHDDPIREYADELEDDLVRVITKALKKVDPCSCCGETALLYSMGVCHACGVRLLTKEPKPDEQCSICHEPLGAFYGAPYKCSHEFHVKCYKQWQKNCPLCRQ